MGCKCLCVSCPPAVSPTKELLLLLLLYPASSTSALGKGVIAGSSLALLTRPPGLILGELVGEDARSWSKKNKPKQRSNQNRGQSTRGWLWAGGVGIAPGLRAATRRRLRPPMPRRPRPTLPGSTGSPFGGSGPGRDSYVNRSAKPAESS